LVFWFLFFVFCFLFYFFPVPFSPRRPYTLTLPSGASLALGDRTLVMGILNITPDSFADGGAHFDAQRAVDAGARMVEDGADILDVGGESTRPGAAPVGAEEEKRRVLPVIEALASRVKVPISIDTYKADVADEACNAGASIVNDISGLVYDPALGNVAARRKMPIVLMHTRGRSADMYKEAVYSDPVREVADELGQRVAYAVSCGIAREQIVIDPGLGFAKRAEHSFGTLAHLDRLAALDLPILVGASRKSFLKRAVGDLAPDARDWATAGAVAAAVLLGAHIVRVHAVKEMADVVRVADTLRRSRIIDSFD
jgi:dihydropteroate synthase